MKLTKYIKLRYKIKELQALAREMEDEVKNDLKDIEGKFVTKKYGTLYTSTRTNYTWAPETKEKLTTLKNQIEEVKQKAIEDGAEKTESVSIGFRL